jgi:hypothetical protein
MAVIITVIITADINHGGLTIITIIVVVSITAAINVRWLTVTTIIITGIDSDFPLLFRWSSASLPPCIPILTLFRLSVCLRFVPSIEREWKERMEGGNVVEANRQAQM